MPPKAILFDLDGTLLDRDASVRHLVEAQYEVFRGILGNIPRDVFTDRVQELDAHGHGDKDDVYEVVAAGWNLEPGVASQMRDYFRSEYHGHCVPFPEVRSALDALKLEGVRLGIITNGTSRIQAPAVRAIGIDDLMDAVLVSEAEGIRKPAPQIFHRGVARLGVEPFEAWFVGDHPVTDVAGAYDAGLTAVWRYTPYWSEPDVPCLTVAGLDAVVRAVRQ